MLLQQAQLNQQSAQAAAQAEVQKNQALNAGKAELMQIEAQMNAQKLQQETQLKKELMELEFQYNMQLKNVEVGGIKDREKQKEDRKDERTKIQASQQSEMIEQRNSGKPPKNFESAGNDILGGGFDLGSFDPS
jgi:hypothetical protein